ncbi:MAG: hypothetical protein IPJ19_04225 [Planctomycetes bacterium]|nr:hypothetical protein [Planctomycetota bacterium]
MTDRFLFRAARTQAALLCLCLAAPAACSAVPGHGLLPPTSAASPSAATGAACRDDGVPRCDNAESQLRLATEARNALRGLEGAELEEARAHALAACRAVRQFFPNEGWACAEASFRAGELLRSAGDLEGAAKEFQAAREQRGESPFRVRALLELGHMQRRAKKLEQALASYEAVLADRATSATQRDEAALWVGSVHQDLHHPDDARRAWQRVADTGDDPLDRIRAFDHIASLLVDQGDLEGAAGTLDRCRSALTGPAAEETRTGERVRSALQNMRAIVELQRAVERRATDGDDVQGRKRRGSKSGTDGEKKEPSGKQTLFFGATIGY